MLVSGVLQDKGSGVATIGLDATLREVCDELRAAGVGALVVSGDGTTIAGIISERDIVRRVATDGAAALELRAAEAMTAEVQTCSPSDTIDQLMRLMTSHRIRHVPVVKAGLMVGLVSIGDVVKSRVSELESESASLHEYLAGGR